MSGNWKTTTGTTKDLRCKKCQSRFAPDSLNAKGLCKICALQVRVDELEMQLVKLKVGGV